MKRMFLFFLVVAIWAGSPVAEAQVTTEGYQSLSPPERAFDIGVRLGGSLSNFAGDLSDASDPRGGFSAGVFARFQVSDRVFVQPEILYAMQGARSGFDDDVATELSYLNVPILFTFQLMEDRGLYGYFGSQIGFLLDAEVDNDIWDNDDNEEVELDDEFTDVDFSIPVGAYYEFANGIGIDLRYNIGITDINDSNISSAEIRNSVFLTSVSYTF